MFSIKSKFFLTGEELSQVELIELLHLAEKMHDSRNHYSLSEPLKDKTIALIFEKPSLRTRLSFTVGIQELGGKVVELTGNQKKSEEPEDTIRVLQGMVQGVMLRTFEHATLEKMQNFSKIPIINGLSDLHHPCQTLADLLTLKQKFGSLQGLKLSYIGDGNNVLHSLLLLAPFVGVDIHYSCPKGYLPDSEILKRAQIRAQKGGAQIKFFEAPLAAAEGTHAIYTDVWTSMGFEKENEARIKAFKGYQLNMEMLNKALPQAVAMHCLPMIKGQEITQEVAEHPRSVLFKQAENRLHAQKALLEGIFNGILNCNKPIVYKTKDHYEFDTTH
jgi:ornithine carbamoyltransferase